MATQTLRKHVWLINTIHNHPGISFREINNKWQCSDLGEGNELPPRTSRELLGGRTASSRLRRRRVLDVVSRSYMGTPLPRIGCR